MMTGKTHIPVNASRCCRANINVRVGDTLSSIPTDSTTDVLSMLIPVKECDVYWPMA